ncbi:hypothetical protein ABIE64_001308 [Thalassospira sp. MBR-102]|jgi:hypothetical protein|uniref:DUF2333 domain-containing protein n=3 Tax=Thalassospira TaxID=168934 RepID=A0ABR5XZF1_9PROT|nr:MULTISPECIES: DUF2333 family protein [Thalassospira]MBR9781790.1 DUF2333 family protein [Rhodospirillales bacterium]KEO57667.1 hypothetical protein SMB34_02855 [Thalassospira permensis NBRC 106175]KZD01774.1 hypothetical protein AUP40_02705 [Thalassospira xiamenensis]KZD11257.1 hypothetical protein AUP45_08295 [Thalassospira xiamenensis]MAB32579.1 DUF2333 domain-containing protein [Thalassospira sp.]|tara:strand:- start:1024 stop:1998 length:975 start_codon:yes stop_codon:yes gene_type:complete
MIEDDYLYKKNGISGFGARIRRVFSSRKFWVGSLTVIVLVAVIYYPVGMALVHKIDDNPDFTGNYQGGSHSVSTASALIDREINQNRWTANDPFFLPSAALDNMPNFQTGIVYALSRFAIELSDQIGRTRGSSQVDPDLDDAAGLLKFRGDKWVFDPSVSLLPGVTSEQQYRQAIAALNRYNQRLADGQAVFERRADNLQETLNRFANDLGSASALIDDKVEDPSLFDRTADDVFYATKGRLYAYSLILRDLGTDFEQVINERQVAPAWAEMIGSLQAAAALDPLVVVNGSADGIIFPNHLAGLGFYLLRARTQMREISSILQR